MNRPQTDRLPASARLAFLLPNMGGGGAERVAITIMSDFLARGYEVDLVLVRAEGELLAKVPAGVRVFDLKARRFATALIPLIRYFRDRKPDAIQVRMWPLTVIGLFARRLARVDTRVVISDHIALSKQYGHLPITFALLRATTRLTYPWADERIFVSAGAADDLVAISGLPREAFEIVYNPAPLLTGPVVVPPQVDAIWGGADGRIITVGSLKEQKNQALLIRAFAILRRRRSARLMILGRGELLTRLQAVAEEEGVAQDVIFPGFSPHPADYVASADLFVLSSDYEGFGNVLVEAMQLGVTVVSTDCPSGPREILGDGEFGRLVPVGDPEALAKAMETSLRSPSDPAKLKARAEQLSGSAIMDRYLDLMLGRKTPKPE
jgi:glycosyltransferase involved in cell wall biosynthesis